MQSNHSPLTYSGLLPALLLLSTITASLGKATPPPGTTPMHAHDHDHNEKELAVGVPTASGAPENSSGEADDREVMREFGKQVLSFVKSLPTEHRNQLFGIITKLNTSKAQLIAEYKNFSESLTPDEMKNTANAIYEVFELMKQKMINRLENSSLNGTALAVYKQLKQLVLNDSLSPMAECEAFQAIDAKLTPEDRAALQIKAPNGGGEIDCKRIQQTQAKWMKGLEAEAASSGASGKNVDKKHDAPTAVEAVKTGGSGGKSSEEKEEGHAREEAGEGGMEGMGEEGH